MVLQNLTISNQACDLICRHLLCLCFQGPENIDKFLNVVDVKLRRCPYVLFIALKKTSQQSVLDETEECWRLVSASYSSHIMMAQSWWNENHNRKSLHFCFHLFYVGFINRFFGKLIAVQKHRWCGHTWQWKLEWSELSRSLKKNVSNAYQ